MDVARRAGSCEGNACVHAVGTHISRLALWSIIERNLHLGISWVSRHEELFQEEFDLLLRNGDNVYLILGCLEGALTLLYCHGKALVEPNPSEFHRQSCCCLS